MEAAATAAAAIAAAATEAAAEMEAAATAAAVRGGAGDVGGGDGGGGDGGCGDGHLAVVAVVPGSGAGKWSVGCAAAGVVETRGPTATSHPPRPSPPPLMRRLVFVPGELRFTFARLHSLFDDGTPASDRVEGGRAASERPPLAEAAHRLTSGGCRNWDGEASGGSVVHMRDARCRNRGAQTKSGKRKATFVSGTKKRFVSPDFRPKTKGAFVTKAKRNHNGSKTEAKRKENERKTKAGSGRKHI
eukprot:scaffold40518_cov107-Phaeocystis_antarctica.AAC.5